MGSDWFSQGQLGLAATVLAGVVLAGAVLAAIVLAGGVLAAAGLARAAAASANKTDKDAAMMAGGGIRRARRPPGRGLITGISFIEPSLDSICRPFSIGGYPPRKLRRPA
jgi:type IV secretory pathway TrbL component